MSEKRMKPAIRFAGFTDDWDRRKLGELAEIGDIDHRMPLTVMEGIPYLMTGDFCGHNELNFSGVKLISENDYGQLSKKIKPEKDDIIFARYASVGAVRYVDFTRDFLVSYSCAIIKSGRKITQKYLYQFLTSDVAQKQIRLEINTGSQANIGIDSMKNSIIISVPCKSEQVKISGSCQTSTPLSPFTSVNMTSSFASKKPCSKKCSRKMAVVIRKFVLLGFRMLGHGGSWGMYL